MPIPVISSGLQSFGYDEATCTLEIEFHSGGVYQYSRVPLSVYQGLMGALSHCKFFHVYIKNNYSYQRIS